MELGDTVIDAGLSEFKGARRIAWVETIDAWGSDVQGSARRVFASPPSPNMMGEAFAALINATGWAGEWAWLSGRRKAGATAQPQAQTRRSP